MATSCPRHNNVMQFLEVAKNCQVTWLESSKFLKKSYFNFALTLYRPTHQICHVSNLRVVRNDLEFPRKSANFSEFVILQIIFYLWLL